MPKKGYKQIEEHKRKIGKGNKGKIISTECREKLRVANLGKHLSEETKEKIRIFGKIHPNSGQFKKGCLGNWKGGISFELYSVDWTETLRRSIRERDNYICQLCSQYGNVVHHKDYCKKNCNPDNLITLCRRCNVKVNTNRNYWTDYFKNKLVGV